MKLIVKITLVLTLIAMLSLLSAANDFKVDGGVVNNLELNGAESSSHHQVTRFNVPDHSITHPPVTIMSSFYDYFPGSYGSFPMVTQPSPAGMYDGGGHYIIYHAIPAAGGVRRAYYAYIVDGVVINNSLINLAGAASEGFPGVDMDMESGNPFASWHGANPENDPLFVNYLTFDQYNLIGTPGLWNAPYVVTDNPSLNEEYIWPVVKIGDSPTAGMRRVYVLGSNAGTVGPSTQGHNTFLSFADFMDASDLASYSDDDWTHYEVPYMRDLAMEEIRPYFDFTVTDDGKVIIAGTIFDWGAYGSDDWPGGYSDNDVLFVLVNDNWGVGETEADWQMYTQDANMQVENPDGYFEDETTNLPHDYLYMLPFAPRFTVDVDQYGDVIFSCHYRMSATQGNSLYFNQGFAKFIKFNFNDQDFTVTDLYPRSENLAAQPYVPWDPEGDGEWSYDNDGFLEMTFSWPVYWWNDEDFQPENYTRIAQSGNYVAAVFQESIKARMINEYGDDAYAGWQDKPELYIMTSADNGNTWNDPIVMNANPQDGNFVAEFDGMIPSYVYPGDTIDDLGDGWGRLHLFFYDMNDYGSNLQGNGPNTGGDLSYMAIDIQFGTNVEEGQVVYNTPKMLKANYPNPFNPSTTIEYSVPSQERVNLSVYNVKGQLVKTLVDNTVPAGDHFVTWNGRDEMNREASSGVYFYKLETESASEMRKMIMVK